MQRPLLFDFWHNVIHTFDTVKHTLFYVEKKVLLVTGLKNDDILILPGHLSNKMRSENYFTVDFSQLNYNVGCSALCETLPLHLHVKQHFYCFTHVHMFAFDIGGDINPPKYCVDMSADCLICTFSLTTLI